MPSAPSGLLQNLQSLRSFLSELFMVWAWDFKRTASTLITSAPSSELLHENNQTVSLEESPCLVGLEYSPYFWNVAQQIIGHRSVFWSVSKFILICFPTKLLISEKRLKYMISSLQWEVIITTVVNTNCVCACVHTCVYTSRQRVWLLVWLYYHTAYCN